MKTLRSRELVAHDGSGELFLVEGQSDGSYVLYHVQLTRVGRWTRKWQAAKAAREGSCVEGRLE